MIQNVVNFVVGGLVVTLVSYLPSQANYKLAGLIAIMPAITLVSYLTVSMTSERNTLFTTVFHSFKYLILMYVFLGVTLALLKYTNMPSYLCVILSFLAWSTAAYMLVFMD